MDLHDLLVDTTPAFVAIALLFGRLAIGICFIVHGLGKLGIVGPGSLAGFTQFLEELGVPRPALQARIAMLSELLGGALLTVGFLTRPACILLIGTMLVAAFLGHKGGGYLTTNDPPGNEYPLNLAVVCAMFVLLGPGAFSLDAYLFGG